MKIVKIKISNYRNFDDLSVRLNDFNLLVGANASGKSNFVQAFQFLRDIVNHGLEDAISRQGGVEYLRNIKIAESRPLLFHVVMRGDTKWWLLPFDHDNFNVTIHEIDYEFSLKFGKKGYEYAVDRDRMTLTYSREDPAEKFSVSFFNRDGKLGIESTNPDVESALSFKGMPIFREQPGGEEKTLLIESPLVGLNVQPALDWLSNIGIYDFDPKLPKRATPISGPSELTIDGSNLAIVLNKVLSDEESKRGFLNLSRDLLPFLRGVDVEKVADKSIFFKLKEKYAEKADLPAFLISDGTINMIALIIALYFQEKRLSIIEEPERNIHPHLISKVMTMFREASKKKQIIATTHNPEMVKQADLEHILLVKRDGRGFSKITKPADSEQIRIFLENEMGLDDLLVQNLLEV